MIKNIITKREFFIFNLRRNPFLKAQKCLFAITETRSDFSKKKFPYKHNRTITFEERVLKLDQELRTKLKQGQKNLLDDENVKKSITEIDSHQIEEVLVNPVLISKLISVHSLLKIIPNQNHLKIILKCFENNVISS